MFAYIDTTANAYGNAAIEMPGLMNDEPYCLEFYYHMHGSDIYALGVSLDITARPLFNIESGRSRHYSFIPFIKRRRTFKSYIFPGKSYNIWTKATDLSEISIMSSVMLLNDIVIPLAFTLADLIFKVKFYLAQLKTNDKIRKLTNDIF